MRTIPYLNYTIPKNVNNIYHILDYKFKYIPYLLAEDIANVISYWKAVGKNGGVIGSHFGFSHKYRKFLYSIPFDLYKETTPYYMAVEIIKDLSSKYNLRAMEKAIISQDENYIFIEKENFYNPDIDIKKFNSDVLEILNINSDNISLELIKILKETEKFTKLYTAPLNLKVSKMTSFNQIKTISKYKLKLPTFNYKYPLKNYNIKHGSPSEIIIFRDVSQSAKIMDSTMKALLLHFINTYKGKTIIIHEFTNIIEISFILKSIKDIKKYYKKSTNYYFARLKFIPNFIKNYSECYIVSKGASDIYPRTLNCIINGISKGNNKSLKLLCANTKGKYILV